MSLGIDSIVWVFDGNHREYAPNPDGGRPSGPPIYAAHWRPKAIVSETSRSWILSSGMKIPKKRIAETCNVCYTEAEMLEDVWVHDNRHRIAEAVRQTKNAQILMRIDAILKGNGVTP